MDDLYKRIRRRLRSMPISEAVQAVTAFGLLDEESAVVIACDVYRMSQVAAADKYNMSLETVKRRRAAAYCRMAQTIEKEKRNGHNGQEHPECEDGDDTDVPP